MGKSKVEAVRAIGALQKTLRDPLYSDTAKPLKEPRIFRTDEQELRQRGARRRDQDLGADGLERRSSNK
eukprot:6211108-Pleurochrysis_carterae.AAC.1